VVLINERIHKESLDGLQINNEESSLHALIRELPLAFMGEILLKGSLCISQNLAQKLLLVLVKAKEELHKIDVDIKKHALSFKIVVKKKRNMYGCLLKIKKIEINAKSNYLILHLAEPPQIRTNSVLQNIFVGIGTKVTHMNSGEEFIINYLFGNKRGIDYSDNRITMDLRKMAYINEIYSREIFGLKLIDVVDIKEVIINEGMVEIFWDVAMPSVESFNLD
jgi:hypothetical protein